ncbi:MAG TPA: isoprenylcysteine carboxylmethyltransferase family protein [Myxococcota bacterium]|nr:isoprenylcysteine carboxylmethyltransferase family protein [Myxococcota bacterium]
MALLIKNLLFTLVAPGTVAVYVPLLIARGHPRASDGALASALLLLGLGGFIYGWCVWDFAVFGRGTPAPIDAPKKLVVRGLYQYTRNPMYVGVLTVILGWAAFFEVAILLVYALAVFAGFQLFIVLYEEPHLLCEFGREYEAYRDRVGRWLLKPRYRRPA